MSKIEWTIRLIENGGSTLPTPRSLLEGVVVRDRRSGAHDLIHEACADACVWPTTGDVYRITGADTVRTFRVNERGHMEPVT